MEGKQRRTSYDARFKRKVIIYAEKNGNRQAAREFNVAESNVRLWRRHKLTIFASKAGRKKFTGPRKGRHPGVDQEVLEFVRERRKNGLPVTSDTIRNKAEEVALALNIPKEVFKASRGWVDRFMKRMGLSLRRRTTICQKLPADFEEKLQAFQRYVIELRKRNNFLMGQIGNADETPIWFDMPRKYTITDKGAKEVTIRTSGCEKQRVTVMLAITADGCKLPPIVIFKRKTSPKTSANEKLFPDDVIVRNQEKGWMTESVMLDWLKNVWGRRPGALFNLPSMLCLDAFRGHLTDEVKKKLRNLNSELVVIPGGMTSVLQPLDVSVNKPFKVNVQRQYEKWLCEPNRELTSTGKIKRAAPHVVAHWVSAAWRSITAPLIEKSFKKCCISNVLDGSEDDVLWSNSEDDGESSNESDTDVVIFSEDYL